MNQLKEMLEAYRNGERGLPTYDELAAVVAVQEMVLAALQSLEVSANSAQYCYDRRPDAFASALTGLGYDAENARQAIKAAQGA